MLPALDSGRAGPLAGAAGTARTRPSPRRAGSARRAVLERRMHQLSHLGNITVFCFKLIPLSYGHLILPL